MLFDYEVFDNPSAHKVKSNKEVVNVEKSVDCVKEECIIHYEGDYENCVMKVMIVNGKREGMALILSKDCLQMRMEYVNDILNGVIEIYNKVGDLIVRGHLLNGSARGLFEEYLDSFVIWRGYFDNRRRRSVVKKSERWKGYYEERSVENNKLLSISEYDKDLVDKNGHCFEYENGVMKEVIEEFRGQDEMGRDENEERRKRQRVDESKKLCLDSSSEFNKDSLVLYDIELECSYGVWKTNEKCYEIKQSVYENRVIEVDLKSSSMRIYNDNELEEECVRGRDCIDLDVSGRRWEGGVKNGEPFGYGIFYNEEGRKEFEGFMMGNRRVCCGREYYSDIGVVKYDGCYYEGKRFGKGVLYGRNGGIEYDEFWKDDEHYKCDSRFKVKSDYSFTEFINMLYNMAVEKGILESDEDIHNDMEHENPKERPGISNHVQSVSIPSDVFYTVESFILSHWLHSLKKIVIRNNCFGRAHYFVLDGLNELESVEIGGNSFVVDGSDDCNDSSISNHRKRGGSYRVVNCPKLKSMTIGNMSFRDDDSFELKNLPSLQFMSFYHFCFVNAEAFLLTDFPHLQSVKLGLGAFALCSSIVFENLPELRSIELDKYALRGDFTYSRETIEEEPYNYKNTLIMKNLPSLTSFTGKGSNFECVGSVILESIDL